MNEFRRHIEEAIIINLKRLPCYGSISFGYSIPISLGLIFFELTIWPLALYFDLTAKRWYRSDRKVMVDDFISMDKIGHWNDRLPEADRPRSLWRKPGLYAMRLNLIKLLVQGSWDQADRMLINYRSKLDENAAHQYFLYKHFLESIHRSLRLTRLWDQKDGLGTELIKYRRFFIIIQALGLEYCIFLDILAYPLYKRGIAIIKNDVPHIPLPEQI